jgi:sec-independent protein translocase protein TatA
LRNDFNNAKTCLPMFGLGVSELAIILFIIVFFFGGKKIPQLMRGLGRSLKSFKEGKNSIDDH